MTVPAVTAASIRAFWFATRAATSASFFAPAIAARDSPALIRVTTVALSRPTVVLIKARSSPLARFAIDLPASRAPLLASCAALTAACAAMIASACACVIVPFATRVESKAASFSAPPGLLASTLVAKVRIEDFETCPDFGAATAEPNDPAVSATVVIAIANTVFFEAIFVSPIASVQLAGPNRTFRSQRSCC